MTLFLAFAALAAASGDSPPAQAKEPAAEKLVCKRLEMTGSRVGGKRVCRTQAQWDAITQQDQQAVREMTKLNPGGKAN